MKTNLTKDTDRDLTSARIAHLLTRAVLQLDDNTLSALRKSRNIALERHKLSKPVSMLSTGHGLHWLMPHSTHQWVATVILFLAVIFGGVHYWQHTHEVELAHLDAAILTDDMPLEAFVDNYTHPGQ